MSLTTKGVPASLSVPRFTVVATAIAVATIALMAPALGGPFLWDDEFLIPNNGAIHSFVNWTDWFRSSLFDEPLGTTGAARYWRPLALVSFALEWHFVGNNPALFHATNLLLYLLVVLLVAFTLRRYTNHPVAALLGTAVFALHPTHVECAAWISGRMDLLVTIGILGCCWACGERLRGRRGAIGFEIGFAAIAYLSKETAVLLPLFCFAEGCIAHAEAPRSRPFLYRLTLATAPQCAIALLYAIARWLWFPLGVVSAGQPTLGAVQRLSVFLETLGRSGTLSVFPYPQRAQHGLVSLGDSGFLRFQPSYLVAGVVMVAALPWLLFVWRRRTSVLIAIALSWLTFLPTSNLFSPWLLSSFTFERYLFLPHVGLVWCVAIAAAHFSPRVARFRSMRVYALIGVASVGIASTWAWRTHERSMDYADAERFWRHELRVNARSSIAPWYLSVLSTVPTTKLSWLRLCHSNASTRGQLRDADDCLTAAAEVLSGVLRDAQSVELERLELAWLQLLRGDQALDSAMLPIAEGVVIGFPRDRSRRERILAANPGRIEADLALLYSRQGKHAAALEMAEASLARCARCRWTAPIATVFSAAGQHERALTMLESWHDDQPDWDRVRQQTTKAAYFHARAKSSVGPERVHAIAQSFISIGRFGLAFDVLRPEEVAILEAPGAAHDYAVIAHRAGHDAIARRALQRYQPTAVVDATLRDWDSARLNPE